MSKLLAALWVTDPLLTWRTCCKVGLCLQWVYFKRKECASMGRPLFFWMKGTILTKAPPLPPPPTTTIWKCINLRYTFCKLHFKVDTFWGWNLCAGKELGRHKNCLPCKNGCKSTKCIKSTEPSFYMTWLKVRPLMCKTRQMSLRRFKYVPTTCMSSRRNGPRQAKSCLRTCEKCADHHESMPI